MRTSPVLIKEITATLSNSPAELEGLCIAHISDLHFRRWSRVFECAQQQLQSLEYDMLCVTGDLGTSLRRWSHTTEFIHRFFEPLANRCPIYAVLGNHDHPDLARTENLPIKFLVNESVHIKIHNQPIELAGVDQSLLGYEDLSKALPSQRKSGTTLLLAHYPSTIYRIPTHRVQLQLSGHTHGGQVRFPWLGCIYPHDKIPRRMARGLHRVGDTLLHVNPGIGASPPIYFRINCPPEITLIKLNTCDSSQ